MGEHLIMCLYRTLWFVIIALLHIRVSFGILSHRAVPEKDTHKLHSYERKTFTEFVDHFSFAPSQEFNLTYLISTEDWKPDGPILFYTGNEGSIEFFAQNTGFIFELAKNLSGAVIFAEHRYYGASLPFGNHSFLDRNHFGYLTAEQALADYAKFISDFKCANRQFANSPVISFGGSYGGMLTAWFRQAYPNIVAGGLASSAPIWLFPGMADCHGFYQVTTRAYRQAGGDACISTIREVWSLIDDIVAKRGLASLSDLFKTCRPFPNGDFIYEFTKDYLVTLAMANYPYGASFLGTLPAWPVKEFCKTMADCRTKGKMAPQVEKFACAFFSIYNYQQEEKCLSFDDNSTNLDTNGWELQTCMEMTNPICSDGKFDMFKPSTWDPIEFSNGCQRKFGVRPRMSWAGVQWWAKNLNTVTRLIFSNGDLDPWSAFGVLEEELVPDATVVRIASGAHHLDLRGSHSNDTAEVRAARILIANHIASWVDAWHHEVHPLYCLDF